MFAKIAKRLFLLIVLQLGSNGLSWSNSVTIYAPNGGSSYSWLKNGHGISGAHSSKYVAKSPGVYSARFTASDGCSQESELFILVDNCKDGEHVDLILSLPDGDESVTWSSGGYKNKEQVTSRNQAKRYTALVRSDGGECTQHYAFTVKNFNASCEGDSGNGEDCFVEFNYNTFESGWGLWNDGGDDVYRSTYAFNGSRYNIRLRDNSQSQSSMETNRLSFNSISDVKVDFEYKTLGFSNGEDFFLEYSTDNGYTWKNAKSWRKGEDFYNDTHNLASVKFSAPFTNETRLRIRCDASSNNDELYIDNVKISKCKSSYIDEDEPDNVKTASKKVSEKMGEIRLFDYQFKVSPNPAVDFIDVTFEQNISQKVKIHLYSMNGALVVSTSMNLNIDTQTSLNTSSLSGGVYLLKIIGERGVLSTKIIVLAK